MVFSADEFHEVLELETMYDNAIDYRTNIVRPRHTITTFYYVKTDQTINKDNMNLTKEEIQEDNPDSAAYQAALESFKESMKDYKDHSYVQQMVSKSLP